MSLISARHHGGPWEKIQLPPNWMFSLAVVALVLFPYQTLSVMEIQAYRSSSTSGIHQSKFFRFGQEPTIKAPQKLAHEIFSRTAAENPSAVAVGHHGDQFAYGELDFASTDLSRKLFIVGLCPRDRVVLLVQRSIPMIVAVFAGLKKGCHVPMNGGVASGDALAHVLDALAHVITETEPPSVLCLASHLQRVHAQFAIPWTLILSLEESWTALIDSDIEAGHKILVDPDDGAYIFYTSG